MAFYPRNQVICHSSHWCHLCSLCGFKPTGADGGTCRTIGSPFQTLGSFRLGTRVFSEKNRSWKMKRIILAMTVFCALGAAAPVLAQQTTGNITGRIVDAQGAAVPGVTVTARSAQTGFNRTDI